MKTPEEILKTVNRQNARKNEGKLKIYLGMVAGVGKSCAMLRVAWTLQKQGVDVIVGLVETHGRQETIKLLTGLTLFPRKNINYQNTVFEEFDLDGVLARKPKVVLVDELAHTNAPGSRHEKRYQDVLELLKAGIDVHTCLNVQHIESRVPQVSRITNVNVTEIVPDSIIDRADEVILVDLGPNELLDRLKTGKIYKEEKIDQASQNFFTTSNLTALRELSLRFMSERVDHDLKDIKVIDGVSSHYNAHHKLMVAVHGSPYSESLLRYTRRMAYGLNCDWVAVYVRTSRDLSQKESELLAKNIELVKNLSGELITIQSDDVIEALYLVAMQNDVTQIIVGNTEVIPFWKKPFVKTLPDQLIKHPHKIDISVISSTQKSSKNARALASKKFEFNFSRLGFTLFCVALLTAINYLLLNLIEYRSLGMIYLLGINLCALYTKRYSILIGATASALIWNFLFIPPRYTFVIEKHEDWLMIAMFFVVAFVIGTFTRKLKGKEEFLTKEGEKNLILYHLTKELSITKNLTDHLNTGIGLAQKLLRRPISITLVTTDEPTNEKTKINGDFALTDKELIVADWVIKNKVEAGKYTSTLPSSDGQHIPLLASGRVFGVLSIDLRDKKQMSFEEKMFVDSIARQLAIGIERDRLQNDLSRSMLLEESERIYKTLLSSVSHELRTPLAAIKGFSSALLNPQIANSQAAVLDLSQEISQGVTRLDVVVQNLLDMSRLEAGNFKLKKTPTDLREIVESALRKVILIYGNRAITVTSPENLSMISLDSYLIEQCFENILRNAFLYTSQYTPIEVAIIENLKDVQISFTDHGTGIKSADPNQVFNKFYREDPTVTGGTGLGLSICKSIIEYHHGNITADNILPHGAQFVIHLPKELSI